MNKNIFLTSFLSLLFLLTGCEQDIQDVDMATGGNEPVPLNIVIGDMEDYGDTASPETRSMENMVQSFVQPLDSTMDTGIDIVTTVEMLPAAEKIQTRANLEENTPFHVKIYNVAGEEVASCKYKVVGTSAVLSEGEAPVLVPGVYKFVCFTYNMPYEVLETPVSVWPGDDFSTYCVTKNITAADHTLNIVFKHQMSQVQFAISSNLGDATFTSAKSDSFYGGSWPVSFNSTDDTKIGNLEPYLNALFKDKRMQYAIPLSKTVSLTFNDVTVAGKNYGEKVVSVPVNFVKGGNYKITVHFDKSYPYTEINGVKWAVSNLSYTNGRVTVSSNPGEKYNLLFCGGSLLGYDIAYGTNVAPVAKPSEYKGSADIQHSPSTTNLVQNPSLGTGDPCQYYLGYSWRLPTRQDVYDLGGGIKVSGEITNAVWRDKGTYGLQYVSGVFMGPNAASAQISGNTVTNNCIFIPARGYYNPDLGFADVDTRGAFWTSYVSNSEMYSVGAGHYSVTNTVGGYYSGGSVRYGLGVRCVHK